VKVYTLRRQQLIRRPIDEVFRFFEEPGNLTTITPRSVGFEILTPPPILMHSGTVLDYTIKIMGIPVRWTTLITDYEPPHRFADVALRSPYSLWHHTHTFIETEGSTLMTDEVRYALPFWALGRLVHSLWVRGQLQHIFDYRETVIRRLLEET
jgi:ligand-binding SRPBCC domain-containing protein